MQSSSRILHRLHPPARAMLWLLLCGLMTASAEAQSAGRPQSATVPGRSRVAAAPATAHDRRSQIVAVVNRQPISRDELARECIRRFGVKVLESEVNKRLILEACREQGVRVTRREIEEEINRVATKVGLPADRLLQTLQSERDISPEQYRRDIIWPMLCLRKLAASRLTISKAELDQAYESEFGAMVQVRMIAAESPQRAEQLRAEAARRPEAFDILAKDYSEDTNSAAARGLIPPVRKHVGDPQIEQVVFAMQPGDISPVVAAAGQYFIFRCERHIPPRELTAEQQQQVKSDLREAIADRKLQQVADQVFEQLQSRAKIVNVHNDPALREEMPSVAALVNDQPVTMAHLGEQCIIRYGESVLEGEIQRKLLTQALQRRSQQVTQAELRQEIARAADSFGFVKPDGTADVDRWLEHVTRESEVSVDIYVRDVVWPSVALKKLVGSTVQVTAEDLQKGFEANYGERVEVLAIVLSNQRTAHEVFEMARGNPTDKFFGELANQYSIEPVSRANFGQVPPVRRWGGQPLIEEEAYRLQPGEISGILASGDKFIILRCLGRTQPVVTTLDAVRDELEKDIREKKTRIAMNDEFERIKSTAQVDNFLHKAESPGRIPVQPVSLK